LAILTLAILRLLDDAPPLVLIAATMMCNQGETIDDVPPALSAPMEMRVKREKASSRGTDKV
jgi:hypothetical protein